MNFEYIKNEFKSELSIVDNFIKQNLKSHIELIDDIGKYIIFFGGKRIRPLITILVSKILNNNDTKNLLMASVIELIHTATLLHDDVVDLSEKRRGKLSVNKAWGNKEAILVGDFLYTRSFQMMVSTNNIDILKLMANTTNTISEGEVNQLVHKYNFDINYDNYFDIIKAKTAQLFAAASGVVPILASADKHVYKNAFDYGMHLGIAYQLIDDILDYSSNDDKFGKNTGDDILNGTFTLPLIYLMKNDARKKLYIKNTLAQTSEKPNILKIKDAVLESNAIIYTTNLAKEHADLAKKALLSINDSRYTQMALSLVDFVIDRKF